MSDDDDLPPPGLDLTGYFRVLAARLGRRPTLEEVAVFRHDVCAERLRRIRRRKAVRKAARRVPAARMGNRGGKEPDTVTEFLTSLEWACAVSLMLSFIVCLTQLASLRVRGRRVTVRAFAMTVNPAPAPPVPGEEPAADWMPPPLLGSYTPDAVMVQFKATEDYRRGEVARLHGDPLYPRALAALLRASGTPIGLIEGRDAWDIVRETDPAVHAHLRPLGSDPDNWKPLRLEVRAAAKKASEFARRAANPQPGEIEREPGFLDRMMQSATPNGAAAYCARQHWRKAGTVAAAVDEVANLDLDAAIDEPGPAKEQTHG